MIVERIQNENFVDYANRLMNMVDDGVLNWKEWSDNILGVGIYSGETCVKNGRFAKKFLEKMCEDDKNSLEKCGGLSQKSYEKCDEIILERKKLQDATRELNEERRAKARNELIDERIINAINRLPKFEVKKFDNEVCNSGKTGLLLFSDIHAGSTYEIKGLHGEYINKYNWAIMVSRMEQILFDMQNNKINGMKFDRLVVGCLGDFVEGILRDSSLAKLREPVIDSVIRFSEYYSNWLVELYTIVECPITVITVGGNHDVARFLTSKPQFDGENFAKLIREFIAIRLKGIQGIDVKPYTEFDVEKIYDTNVGFAHGTDKDMSMAMDYFGNLYNYQIDELYAGHLHGNSQQANGISNVGDRLCTRIGSICGLDTFSHKIRKASKASYYFATYEEFYGKTWQRVYYLN